MFWRWHSEVDKVREDYAADKAAVVSMDVLNRTTVVVEFDLPVSFDAPAINTAQLRRTSLTVNNRPASRATTLDNKTFTFTVAIPPRRISTIKLTGNRGVK